MKTEYRAEIDGLRCLAVLPVMLFHAGIDGFSGGFVGVDVFFVISGYLITRLILGEMERGEFSLVRFYERRVRRILPALFLVIFCCLPIAWFWLLPLELRLFAQSVMAVLLFLSNFLFFQESGYFGPTVDYLPLIHTWSLAVEEQFYLFFPLLLLVTYRFGVLVVTLVLVLVTLVSLILSGTVSATAPNFAFYLLPARAWELFFGALAALYLGKKERVEFPSLLNNFLALTGLLLIVFAVISFNEITVFPGWAALIPVIGSVLIIVFAQSDTWLGTALRVKPMVFVGLISYSAYLWHQPLFAFARIRSLDEPGQGLFLSLVLASLCLAWFSWKFVELPFRNREKTSSDLIFRTISFSAVFLLSAGIFLDSKEGHPKRLPQEYLDTIAHVFAVNPRENECISGGRFLTLDERCVYGPEENIQAVIWGDSHANALAFGVGAALENIGVGMIEHSHNACPPAVGLVRPARNDRCLEFNEEVANTILENDDIDVVILLSRWSLYVEGSGFDNGEGGVENSIRLHAVPVDQPDLAIDSLQRKQYVAELYLAQIRKLVDGGKRVVLVHPVPEAGWDVPNYLAREILFGVDRDEFLSTSYSRYKERNSVVLDAFSQLSESPNLIQILPQDLICDSLVPDRCIVEDGRGPLYSDDDHLHIRINEVIAQYIIDALGY